MKFTIGKLVAIATLASASALLHAQEVTVADVAGSPGVTTPAINVDYVAGGSVVGFQFDILFDQASLGAPTLSCNSNLNNDAANCGLTCSNPSAGVIRVICADLDLSVQTSGSIGSFTFDIPGGTPVGLYNLEIDAVNNGAGFSDSGGASVAPSALNDGSVTLEITGSAGYDSTPAPGETINLGSAVVGQTSDTATDDIVVSEIGDQQLEITALPITGVDSGDFATSTAPFNIADGGADVDVDLSCSPTSRGDLTASIELTNNSSNVPNPQYTLECAGLSPNVQVPAGPVNLTGLTVDPDPTANINLTNPQDGFASDATNVTATAGAGDTEITVSGGPTTIPVNDSFDFIVSCDSTADGSFTRTIDFAWDDPVGPGTASIEVNCTISDAVASFDSNPAAPGPINFGTITNGVTSAAIGIDVTNDGVGPSPESDLTIATAVSSDPQYTVNLINTGPFIVGDAADGVDDIEVTCTPDPGTNGPLPAATLTVTHDGDDSPTVFDLECAGQSDGAFSSTPSPGGTLTLPTTPPAVTSPEGTIDFFNNGDADEIEVSCTFDDPDGVFDFSPDPFDETIAPGGSVSAAFQCTPPTPTAFEGTLTCEVTGDDNFQSPINYTVACRGQPLVIPTMNQWGLVIMSLILLMVGGLVGRRWFANQA